MIGILLPTRGRYVPLRVCLDSLSEVDNAGDLEVIIVCDDDETSFNLANDFDGKSFFGEYRTILTQNRMYSVGAFNKALENPRLRRRPDGVPRAAEFGSSGERLGILSNRALG